MEKYGGKSLKRRKQGDEKAKMPRPWARTLLNIVNQDKFIKTKENMQLLSGMPECHIMTMIFKPSRNIDIWRNHPV